jgi:hypothetical protein
LITVTYRWTKPPGGSTPASLPKTTYLASCSRCFTGTEFTADGRLFEHPHNDVLGFTRMENLPMHSLRAVPTAP